MIFKGKITSINSLTCSVYVPALTPAGSPDVILKDVHFSITPGIYGGYAVDDIVFISFEENDYKNPIILGKLLTNTIQEGLLKTGHIAVNSISAKSIITNAFLNNSLDIKETTTTAANETQTSSGSADYQNAINQFSNAEAESKSTANTKLFKTNAIVKYTTFKPKQIGLFGTTALNSLEPKKIRQEFLLDVSGNSLNENISYDFSIKKFIKINTNETFLITDKTTLNPGTYNRDETGIEYSAPVVFEVKPNLIDKKINIFISGPDNLEIKQVYITIEYV